MSNYGWEAGTIRIPTKDWPAVKLAVRNAHAKLQGEHLALAVELHGKLAAAGKGKRGFAWRPAAQAIMDDVYRRRNLDGRVMLQWMVLDAVLPPKRPDTGSGGAPVTPAAKSFPKPNSATVAFAFGEAGIRFDEKAKTVAYSSGDNNHAVENAREHPLAVALFHALGKVTWTRGSGGTLTGNNEYNRDAKEAGGGSNYVTETYPPPPPAPGPSYMGAHRRDMGTRMSRRW